MHRSEFISNGSLAGVETLLEDGDGSGGRAHHSRLLDYG